MTEPLNPLERRVYHFLIDFLAENTYQPSIREIGKKFRIKSTKTVSDLLQSLADKGYIERDPSRSRGVRLLGYSGTGRTQPVPCFSTLAAGPEALAPERREGFITTERRFVPSEGAFYVRVSDDALTGRAIVNGDYLLFDPAARPQQGDIVLARVGAEHHVRILSHQGLTAVLKSANPQVADIAVKPEDGLTILGVMCGLFRSTVDQSAAARVS